MNLLAGKKIIERRKEIGDTQEKMAERLAKALNQTYSKRQYQKLEEGKFPRYKTEIVIELDKILGTEIHKMVYEQKVPRGTSEIPIVQEGQAFYSNTVEASMALNAAVKVLKAQLIEIIVKVSILNPEETNRTYSDVLLEVDRLMQEELQHAMGLLKKKSEQV